ncbi:hypothetical protein JWG39_06080 [Desulforhopalus vacuolatus]|uniref:circadian clock KaiB family protein n=1 Tax=Desulforhopalus vacuolatus TaxID=40414 RepID=UPI001964D5AF|nr:circadian clock KaiB family protein [Desulforhopalus vacuolatus]MBM9519391.1 hypothetical protein [Desulforhopalus vacuolatus]
MLTKRRLQSHRYVKGNFTLTSEMFTKTFFKNYAIAGFQGCPGIAEDEKIIATPTLIKTLPEPLRRVIGDLSNNEKVLLGLDLKPIHSKDFKEKNK